MPRAPIRLQRRRPTGRRRRLLVPLVLHALFAVGCGGGGGDAGNTGVSGGQSPPTNTPTNTTATTAGQWTRAAVDARLKSGITAAFGGFGHGVALSESGTTLAVSAVSSFLGGASVEVFDRNAAGRWTAPVRIPATGQSAKFGDTVRLSRQGNRLLVADYDFHGPSYEDAYGFQTGVANGAVHVYDRSAAGAWTRVATLMAPSPRSVDYFGRSAGISADGRLIAVGVPNRDFETLAAERANLVSVEDSGSVFVYAETAPNVFTLQQQLRAPFPGAKDNFGQVLALSGDGSTLVVASPGDDSAGSGVVPTDALAVDSASVNSGILHVFAREADGRFVLQANLKSGRVDTDPARSTPYDFQEFGRTLAISHDGDTLVAGATYSIYNAGLVSPPPETVIDIPRGEVTIYRRSGGQWQVGQRIEAPSHVQFTNLYGENISFSSLFGADIALTPDAGTLAVGMTGFSEHSAGGSLDAGAVFTYARDADGRYQPLHSARLPRPDVGEGLGDALALSADGRWLVAGAPKENSGGLGVDPAYDAKPDAVDSGTVYVYDMGRAN